MGCFSVHGHRPLADSLLVMQLEGNNNMNTQPRLNAALSSGALSDRDLRLPSASELHAPSAADFNTAWGVTMPAELDALPTPQPFREAMHGLAMREVNEPDLFRHFFG